MVLFFTWIWFQWVSGFFYLCKLQTCVYICFYFYFFSFCGYFFLQQSVCQMALKTENRGYCFILQVVMKFLFIQKVLQFYKRWQVLKKSRREFIYKTSTIKYTCFKIIKQKYIKMQLFSRLSVFYSLNSERWTKMFGTDKNKISIILWQSTVFY